MTEHSTVTGIREIYVRVDTGDVQDILLSRKGKLRNSVVYNLICVLNKGCTYSHTRLCVHSQCLEGKAETVDNTVAREKERILTSRS